MSDAIYKKLISLFEMYGDKCAAAVAAEGSGEHLWLEANQCLENFKSMVKPFVKEF